MVNKPLKTGIIVSVIVLFIVSSITPMVIGYKVETSNKESMVEEYTFDRHLYPEFYDCYNEDEIPSLVEYKNIVETEEATNPDEPIQALDDPMDSAWPMHGHDVRHTGRSPYITANNQGEEKWWFKLDSFIEGSPVIDNDGVIYFGSWDNHLYALYSNGTLKWKSNIEGNVETSPAIAEDGTIYVGTHFALEGNYLYAVNPNGTLKWRYKTGNMYSSPAIGDDGTIYCSNGGKQIIALYPNNGTLKWSYTTGGSVLSSPAIGNDGIVYCGSHDDHVYALNPNGTLKWKFNTGSWVHGFPTIGDDGTVYINSDNGYMYALYPNNGTMKWRCKIGAVWGNPALDKNGNLYVGVWEKKFYAIYPNGIIKWSVDLSRRVWGMSAVISDDGTIYFGTCDFEGHDGGYLHALNPDGTIKWILYHTRMFWASPAIGEDGTVYICTRQDEYKGGGYVAQGRLRALSDLDPDAPEEPTISGLTEGRVGKEYEYTFKSNSPLGKDVFYYIDWGDQMNTGWIGSYPSGHEVKLKHSWRRDDAFKIRVKAKDVNDLWGPWGEFTVNIKPRNRIAHNTPFQWFLKNHQHMFPILQKILCFIL